MKFQAVILAMMASSAEAASHTHDGTCTHGKLFIVDNTTANVHVMDVSGGVMDNMVIETEIALPNEGAGGLVYYGPSADPLVVQYRGEEPDFDGFVRVIDTGFIAEEHGDHHDISYKAPSIFENAIIDDCHRPIHQVRHDSKIAIFCDGAFDAVPQANTTVYVVDETLLGSASDSAIVHSTTLEGAHHGVAVPVDDSHLLHSLALPERILRDPDATSLPSSFQVTDFEENILHEMSDSTDPDTHCAGFHGSAAHYNTFFLACDEVHGGVVIVVYDPSTETYSSRALMYPDDPAFESFRIGSFAYHKKNPTVVGSFRVRDGTEYHLVGLLATSTAIEKENVLTLPGDQRQCSYEYEVGTGEHLLVFMPDGFLHVFEVSNGSLTAVMSQEIVPGMTACSEAAFVAGIGQAFVAVSETQTLYTIDLAHVEEGEMEIYTTTLPFFPTAMTVSGFDLDHACGLHDHDNEEESKKDGAVTLGLSVVSLFVLAGSFIF